MSNKGRTSKPCPGCHFESKQIDPVTGTWRFWKRPIDGVCDYCVRLLKEAEAARAEAEKQPDHRLMSMERLSFYIPRSSMRHNFLTRATLEAEPDDNALFQLYKVDEILGWELFEVSRRLADTSLTVREDQFSSEILYPRTCGDVSGRTDSVRIWLKTEDIPHIRRLARAIKETIQAAYASGRKHGTSLLEQLAAGDLTVDQFNEAALR